jgi:hypothetical protein
VGAFVNAASEVPRQRASFDDETKESCLIGMQSLSRFASLTLTGAEANPEIDNYSGKVRGESDRNELCLRRVRQHRKAVTTTAELKGELEWPQF